MKKLRCQQCGRWTEAPRFPHKGVRCRACDYEEWRARDVWRPATAADRAK